MINLVLIKDSINKHVCEVQLVHKLLLANRSAGGGHEEYVVYRSADELVMALRPPASKARSKEDSVARGSLEQAPRRPRVAKSVQKWADPIEEMGGEGKEYKEGKEGKEDTEGRAPMELPQLVKDKLSNPNLQLTVDQKIECLTACIRYGETQAAKAVGRDLLMVIGNTGAGKSTLVNFIAGCTMERVTRKQAGFKTQETKKIIRTVSTLR